MTQIEKLRANQTGEVNPLVVMIVVLSIAVVGLGGTTVWSYMEMREAQTTVQQQVDKAVAQAKEEQKQADQKRFREAQKTPFRKYEAPDIIGDITVAFPKNWSLYVEESQSGSELLSATMHPRLVRVAGQDHNAYALRMTVEGRLYSDELNDYERRIQRGEVNSRAIKVSGVKGVRLDGQITDDYSGRMIVLPLRDKTVRLWTESDQYLQDFEKVVNRFQLNP